VSDHRNRRIDVTINPPDSGEFQIETVRGCRWERVLAEGAYAGPMLEIYAWRRTDATADGWEQYRVATYQPLTWRSVVFNASLG
jgi:hypothetical protein